MTWQNTITLFPVRAWTPLLDSPFGGALLDILAEEAGAGMLSAYELTYAQQAGYRLGPAGEWIAEAPEKRWPGR
jgi:hypothetical protein